MRIIAGERRGARLKTLAGEDTRPTLERVKEAMFSTIQFVLPGASVLDLYAGSGQLGLEALSRGAARCTFVDESHEAVAMIKENCRNARLYEKSRVLTMGVPAFLAQCKEVYDVILLDPPYRLGIFPGILGQVSALTAPGAVVLCESEPTAEMPQQVDRLHLEKQYRYGTVMVSRYTVERKE